MRKYNGIEIVQALARQEVDGKDKVSIYDKNNNLINTNVHIEDLSICGLIDYTYVIEDEMINIQGLEEIDGYDVYDFNKLTIAINKCIKSLKKIDKKLNAEHCCSCGCELTEQNIALPNMCKECKYGIDCEE